MKRLVSTLLFCAVFIAAGIGLLCLTGASAKRCTEPATGIVTGYETEQTTDSKGTHTSHYPIIRYNYDHRVYEERSNVGGGNKAYADGAKVKIKINPDNPYEFMIEGSNKPFTIAAWAMIVIGVLLLLGDMFGFVKGGGTRRSVNTGVGLASIIYIIKTLKERKNSRIE